MKTNDTHRLFSMLAITLVTAACATSTEADSTSLPELNPATVTTALAATSTTDTTVVDGCQRPLTEPGEYEGSLEGIPNQLYWVIVPDSYKDTAPVPLYLHLAAGSGDHDSFLAGWRPYLDDLAGVMVMVNTADPARGKPEALTALIDELTSEFCIDPKRIHALGTSWSGGMVGTLACESSDRIASFVSALSGHVPPAGCDPERPVPLLSFTGDVDRTQVAALVETWAGINGCDPDPKVEDLGSGVLRKTFENCEADVLFYDIVGMGHAWPLHEAVGPGAELIAVYEEVDYLDEAVRFFTEHPLP